MAGSVELVLLLIYTARYLIFSVMALGVVIQSYANELGNWTATKLHVVQPSLLLLSYCPTAARLQCCYVVPPTPTSPPSLVRFTNRRFGHQNKYTKRLNRCRAGLSARSSIVADLRADRTTDCVWPS